MALGLIESPFLSITALLADRAAKAANVRIQGIETTGNERLLIRLQGEVGAVEAALEAAQARAQELATTIVRSILLQPDEQLQPLIAFPNAPNSLYGGRDQLLPIDFPQLEKKCYEYKTVCSGYHRNPRSDRSARSH